MVQSFGKVLDNQVCYKFQLQPVLKWGFESLEFVGFLVLDVRDTHQNCHKKTCKKVVLSCHITMKLAQPPCFFMKKETAVVNHDNFISIRIFRNSHTTCNLGRYHGGGGCAFEAFFRDHVHITLFTNFHAN